jgi:hypothetical protein
MVEAISADTPWRCLGFTFTVMFGILHVLQAMTLYASLIYTAREARIRLDVIIDLAS